MSFFSAYRICHTPSLAFAAFAVSAPSNRATYVCCLRLKKARASHKRSICFSFRVTRNIWHNVLFYVLVSKKVSTLFRYAKDTSLATLYLRATSFVIFLPAKSIPLPSLTEAKTLTVLSSRHSFSFSNSLWLYCSAKTFVSNLFCPFIYKDVSCLHALAFRYITYARHFCLTFVYNRYAHLAVATRRASF